MSKIEDYYSRERSNSFPETPKRFRSSPLEDSQSKRQKIRMSIAEEKAKEALEGAPTWAKTPFLFLMEQMSKVNEDVINVKDQLEMFKSEVDGRVTQLEKEVKFTQSRYDATSSEMEGLKEDIQEVRKLRGTPEKQLTKIQIAMDDIEQYSRRNCLIFNGIQEQQESHENTDLIVVDICRKNLGVNLSRGDLDRTHRLGRERSSTDKPRPIIVKFVNYHDRDDVFKSKRKLKGSSISIMENLTSRRVSLLKEVKEKVGFRNSWSLDGKIVALFKGKKHIIASREDLSKLG